MQVILKINAIRAENEHELSYRITVTQGAEQISDESDLLENLKDTLPAKRGIISVIRESQSIWKIVTPKK